MKTLIICALFFSAAICVDHAITQSGVTYSPTCIDANVGDTVTATFATSAHNFAQAASNTSTTYNGSGFRSGTPGNVDNTSPYQVALNSQGTIYFICEPHASIGMRGWINVRAAGDNTETCISTPDGQSSSITGGDGGSSGVSVLAPSALLALSFAMLNL